MANLLDGLLPGNRVVTVNDVRPPVTRDTLAIQCLGATIVDDPTAKVTVVSLPGGSPVDWAAAACTVSAAGAGYALGNGSFSAFWRQTADDTLEVTACLTLGTTTNLGTGGLIFDFELNGGPANWIANTAKIPGHLAQSSVSLLDASTPTNNRGGRVEVLDTLRLQVYPNGVAGVLDHLTPYTWATGDTIIFGATIPAKVPLV